MTAVAAERAAIALADSVTALDARHADCVLVSGSHGGLIAARYAAAARVRAVVFNDAGIGRDAAGVAALAALDALGVAAAAVSHRSARIGDAQDTLANGVVSRANGIAVRLGVDSDLPCRIAAERLRDAAPRGSYADVPVLPRGRYLLSEATLQDCAVLGADSVGLVVAGDARCVLIIGSHGGLHGNDPATALPIDARATFFHDAGRGKDDAGVSRLPVLALRGVPAATVDYRSARIGDARSMWEGGIVSCVNDAMAAAGIAPGLSVKASARLATRR